MKVRMSDGFGKSFEKKSMMVLNQIEFYMGDANLRRDRFMSSEIYNSVDGYVALSVFLKFNKIKSLDVDENFLKNALKPSNNLEVDGTRNMVKRIIPFVSSETLDENVIYADNLPKPIDMDNINKVFGEYGKIYYISLPKYHSTRDFKGFAFVEYSSKEEADLACKKLNLYKGSSPPSSFPKGNKDFIRLQRQLSKLMDELNIVEDAISKSPKVKCEGEMGKRRLKESNEIECKKIKLKKDKIIPETLMRVIPKTKWLKMRKKYLDGQKNEYSQMKTSIEDVKMKLNSREPSNETIKQLEMTPNVLVKIEIYPENTKKYIKTIMTKLSPIVYIDMNKQFLNTEAIVRYSLEDEAIKIVNEYKDSDEFKLTMLSGEEESNYWKKINSDRTIKKTKIKNEKIVEKINQNPISPVKPKSHIVFN
ncbi:hypothetical protein A3Q56_02726 [Intoshia linei]|uniref:Uncharacterized protein n=1 Tax=Intoshia linei TaxID=1819745 RepID=A0A177B5H0_9BILA|nr:hypothetical protein A3Q56_02726 [Intoshia linei]